MAREINFEEYNNEVLKSDKLVLIDFFATWCGPCKMLAPVIEQIANENEDVMVVKVDVDKHPEIAKEHGILSIPTIEIYKESKLIDKAIGYLSEEELEDLLK